jgi:CBS domain containing-hemolysin-like protein
MITLCWTFGVLILIAVVSIFAYIERIYAELGRVATGRLRQRLDAFEANIEPRLHVERRRAAPLASLVTDLWLAGLLVVTMIAVMRREPVVWRAVIELVFILGAEIVVALHVVPSILLARSGGRWLRPLVPLVRLCYAAASPLETAVSLGKLLAELREESEPGIERGQGEAIEALMEAAQEEGLLEKDEAKLIEQVVEFSDKRVREVMTPRPDVVPIAATATIEDLRRLSVETKHSRIPVYEGSLDDVVGIVFSRDVLGIPERDAPGHTVRELMRPALLVPESKLGSELLKEMQLKSQQMAIVIDEYGLLAGVVTMEDLVEEIVGEINDEDHRPIPDMIREAADSLVLRGSVGVERLEEMLGVKLDRERTGDATTIAGLLNHLAGHVPRSGEVVDSDGLRFEILEANQRKVLRLRARRLPAISGPAASSAL